MKIQIALSVLAAAVISLSTGTAHAQDCKTDKDPYDLVDAEVLALYDCIKDAQLAGYSAGDNAWAAEYRDWNATATRPALPGFHGERFLNTFANDIAVEQYLKYETEGVVMPVGSVLAKESFKVNKEGVVKRGPLFFMEKVGADAEENSDGWFYSAVQPNGKPMRIKQSFCHDCHWGFADQDGMGYPVEDVRLTN